MAESISARVAWKLKKAIIGKPAKGTSNTGTASFVRTDENGVGWVRLPGADTDTPINGNLVTDMKPGDTVSYRIDGGRLSVMGNATSPATSAGYVQSVVEPVEVKADTAISDASRAFNAAEDAEKSAEIANDAATQAIEDAAAADSAARSAAADAAAAQSSADAAQSSADAASTAATQAISDAAAAQTSADNAAASATQANTSANSALVQLSVIEDVAGTLDWISQHGSYVLTTDTSVVSGKVYFELVSGEYIPIASPDPSANPQQEGWYVLDITDSQTEYIMAHLAVTSAGLWVLPNGIGSGQTPATASGYKVLLSNTGMTVYDSTGADVAHYGTTSRIGSVSALHLLLRATGIVLMPANGESSQQSLKNISDFFVDQDTYLENPLDQSSALLTGLVGKLNNLLSTPSGLIYSVSDDDVLIVTENGAQIGNSSNSHIELDYHSLKLVDKEGNTYFYVSDLRGQDGTAEIVDKFTGDGTKKSFALTSMATDTSYTVVVSDSSGGTITKLVNQVMFSDAPTDGAVITVTYQSNSTLLKAYTFGRRGAGTVGSFSVSEGYGTIASGVYAHAEGCATSALGTDSHAEGNYSESSGSSSHAEGMRATASGTSSHAEGTQTTASGTAAHAEGQVSAATGNTSHVEGYHATASGQISHAEGAYTTASGHTSHAEGNNTTASGNYSHAEGVSTTASGDWAHSQNRGTIAAQNDQTAIGRFNDNQSTSAFEIGNGTADNARSNAFAVDWSGNVSASGDVTAAGDVAASNVSASEDMSVAGDLAVSGDVTASGNLTASNFRDTAMTADLGSSGTAHACRIGSMLVMSGSLASCTVSDTYTWTHLAHIDSSTLGITSVTSMGATVEVSGGGPSYAGTTNGGGTARIVNGVLYADMQTNAAFSSKYVKFIVTAYVE